MCLRGWLKRLERGARGDLASFELLDGSRYYFDAASWETFLHWSACIRAGNPPNWPEPPEVLHKLCEAKDVERALELVKGEGQYLLIPYDPEVLINERRLEPRSLVTGRDVYDQELEDLSE